MLLVYIIIVIKFISVYSSHDLGWILYSRSRFVAVHGYTFPLEHVGIFIWVWASIGAKLAKKKTPDKIIVGYLCQGCEYFYVYYYL